MFIYHYCEKENEYLFNEKININQKDIIIQKYKLNKIGKIKEYWENNILIISDTNKLNFFRIIDHDIFYQDNFLVNSYEKERIDPYEFYKTDTEESYIKYENKLDNIKIILKEYSDYLSFQCICKKKGDFYSQKIFI